MICPRKFGGGVCGCVLEITTVDGILVERCRACDRLARGVCLDCPAPVAGPKSRRCAAHQQAERRAQVVRYRRQNRAKVNAWERLRMARPEVKARGYLKKWRAANPEKVQAQRLRRELRQYRALRGAA